jgi:Rrf2 family cysteine metabolism transcriptional repressor
MAELGLRYHTGPTQIKDIAERHQIPQHYLEQILVVLKKAGFVESFRGAQGGYALAMDPSRIRVQDVLSQLEGALEIVAEGKRGGMLAFFWESLHDSLQQQLDKTLEDLLLEKQRQEQKFTYSI